MVELVKGYEQEFLKHLSSTNKKIASYEKALNQESTLADIKHGISEAEKSLKNMEKEILNLLPQQATLYGPRIKRNQENLTILKKSAKELDFAKNKTNLLGGPKQETREKLLSGNEILQESGETLERVEKLGAETEDIGYKTMNNLKQQRITIQKINDKVNDVGTNVGMASRTITEMNSRRL